MSKVKRTPRESFTSQEILRARSMYQNGIEVADIAIRINSTPASVRSLMARLAVHRKQRLRKANENPSGEAKRLRRLHAAGADRASIAADLRISRSALYHRAKGAGIRLRSVRLTASERKKLRNLILEGASPQKMATEIHRSAQAIESHLSRMNDALWRQVPMIRELTKVGKTDSEIGAKIGVKAAQIKACRKVYGLKRREAAKSWTKAEIEKVRNLSLAGLTNAEISKHLHERSAIAVGGLRRAKRIAMAAMQSKRKQVDEDLVYEVCEELWAEGHKPTRARIAGKLGCAQIRVKQGLAVWTRTCGRSVELLLRGPKVDAMEALVASLPKALRRAPNTALDPANDGRWRAPDDLTLRYLQRIKNESLRAVLTLWSFAAIRQKDSRGVYCFVTSACRALESVMRDASCDDASTMDPDKILDRVVEGEIATEIPERARQMVPSIWVNLCNRSHSYIDQLPEKDRAKFREYALRPISDLRKFRALQHWKTVDEGTRARSAELKELVVAQFYQLRFAAGVRVNQIRRMFNATEEALTAYRREPNATTPYRYSYEERGVRHDAVQFHQQVNMELWSFRDVRLEWYRISEGKGKRTPTPERLPPTDEDDELFPRFVSVEPVGDSVAEPPWLIELYEKNAFSDGREDFNTQWGYEGNPSWASAGRHFLFQNPFSKLIGRLRAKGIVLLPVERIYHAMLFGNLDLRLQSVSGARIGEVQQVAQSPERMVMLTHVGAKERARLVLRMYPKGTHATLADYMVDDETKDVLVEVMRQLYRHYGSNHLPILDNQYKKGGRQPYVFQYDGRCIRQHELSLFLRVLLHGAFLDPETDKHVGLVSHALRHGFATALAEMGVPIHVIAELLNQKDLDTTGYYAAPTKASVREAQELMFVPRVAIGAKHRRLPQEIEAQLREAEELVGALTEVPGGACGLLGLCPSQFQCVGCAANIPDPKKAPEIRRKMEWAEEQEVFWEQRGATSEVKKLKLVQESCREMLLEMRAIELYRDDKEGNLDKSKKIATSETKISLNEVRQALAAYRKRKG